MTTYDAKGLKVEQLAKPTRAELVQWIDQTALAFSRAKREADPALYARTRQALVDNFNARLAELDATHATAPERVEGLGRQLEEWKRQLEALKTERQERQASDVPSRAEERQARAKVLIEKLRVNPGDTQAQQELLRLLA